MSEKLNKSGNRRGMSKGSQEVAKRNNFKNKTPEKRREIAAKGAEATNMVISVKKISSEIAKEEVENTVNSAKGEKVEIRRALIKKLIQMAMNGNLNAYILLLKLLNEMPAEKQEITNLTPQLVVANQDDLKTLEKLKNADFNKGIS